MFSSGSSIRVYDSNDGGVCESFLYDVAVGDLVYTVNGRFCPVLEKKMYGIDHCGVLKSESGSKLSCFYHALFMGYDKTDDVPKQLVANEMVGKYWKLYDSGYSDTLFEKVIDWRPLYFTKKAKLMPIQVCSLVVAEDHTFFVNDVAVYDNTVGVFS